MFAKPLIQLRSDGTFDLNFPPEFRGLLVSLATALEEIMDSDDPATRRLFPTAYADDPEKDAGFQIFSRDALLEQRHAAISYLRDNAETTVCTEAELCQWMSIVNDTRLVIGTALDVSEDVEIDSDDPRFPTYEIYEWLGYLLSVIVDALDQTLDPDGD